MHRVLFSLTNDKIKHKARLRIPLSLLSLIYCGKGLFFFFSAVSLEFSFQEIFYTSTLRKTEIVKMILKDTLPTGMLY